MLASLIQMEIAPGDKKCNNEKVPELVERAAAASPESDIIVLPQ